MFPVVVSYVYFYVCTPTYVEFYGFHFFQAKVDNRRRTGTQGGAEAKYNEIDNIVLDIIGKDSPALQSLKVPETGEVETMDFVS